LTSHYRVDEDTSKEIEKEINEWKDDFPYEYTDDDMIRGDQFPIYNQYISHK